MTCEQCDSSGLQEQLESREGFQRGRDTQNAHRNQDQVATAADGDERRARTAQKGFTKNENVFRTGTDEEAQGKQEALHGGS